MNAVMKFSVDFDATLVRDWRQRLGFDMFTASTQSLQ